jgi:hypothetical protein
MCQMGKGGCIDDKGLEMDVLSPGMILHKRCCISGSAFQV